MIANIHWAKLGPRYAAGQSIIFAWLAGGLKNGRSKLKLTHLIHYLALPLSLSSTYRCRSHTFCDLVSLWHFGRVKTLLWLRQLNLGYSNPAFVTKADRIVHVINITDIESCSSPWSCLFRSLKDVTRTASIKKCLNWCRWLWTQLPQPDQILTAEDSIWNRYTQ